jgi:hypothetical protein
VLIQMDPSSFIPRSNEVDTHNLVLFVGFPIQCAIVYRRVLLVLSCSLTDISSASSGGAIAQRQQGAGTSHLRTGPTATRNNGEKRSEISSGTESKATIIISEYEKILGSVKLPRDTERIQPRSTPTALHGAYILRVLLATVDSPEFLLLGNRSTNLLISEYCGYLAEAFLFKIKCYDVSKRHNHKIDILGSPRHTLVAMTNNVCTGLHRVEVPTHNKECSTG